MFGFFKSRKSPVRLRLEDSISVHRTWVEWTIEDGKAEPILVVEFAYRNRPRRPQLRPRGDRRGGRGDRCHRTRRDRAGAGEAHPTHARLRLSPLLHCSMRIPAMDAARCASHWQTSRLSSYCGAASARCAPTRGPDDRHPSLPRPTPGCGSRARHGFRRGGRKASSWCLPNWPRPPRVIWRSAPPSSSRAQRSR